MAKSPELLRRDASWIEFDRRVLDETQKKIPLADKVMFFGIGASNLDEFMSVRYPACVTYEPQEVLDDLTMRVTDLYQEICTKFNKFNQKHKLIRSVSDLSKDDQKWADRYFRDNIYPALQPVTFDRKDHLRLHSGFYVLVIYEHHGDTRYGYIEIPKGISRFICISKKHYMITVEDMLERNIKELFLKVDDVITAPFVIGKSAEVFVQSDRYPDPMAFVKKTLQEREKSWITYLEIGSNKNKVCKVLKDVLDINTNTVILMNWRIHLADLKGVPKNVYALEDQGRTYTPVNTFPSANLFDYIRKQERLCFHPYESYQASFVKWIEEAASDPNVISIKIALYRVSDNSQIINSLLKASDKGKTVTVLIELKARFDEHHNIEIANLLREGGVRIMFTKPDIKTHAKVCLITRKEKKGLRTYYHIGTGNYSESNSKLYTDYSLFGANQETANDLTRFFNLLTSEQGTFKSKSIVYAPYNMRDEIGELIDEQVKLAKKKKKARIVAKCNALTDESVAHKLIDAANAGVKITLIIRGACIIQPQKNIKIYSIVGEMLEHSRVYLFGTGNNPDILIGSSDLMTRNLSRRHETLIRIEQADIKKRIMKHLSIYLKDNVLRRKIQKNYRYQNITPAKKEKPINCQEWFKKEARRLAE